MRISVPSALLAALLPGLALGAPPQARPSAPALAPSPLRFGAPDTDAFIHGHDGAQTPLAPYAWMPFTAGGLLLVGGGVSLALAGRRHQALASGEPQFDTLAALDASVREGKHLRNWGYGMVAGSLAGLAVGSWMLTARERSRGGYMSVAPMPGGAFMMLGGRLP